MGQVPRWAPRFTVPRLPEQRRQQLVAVLAGSLMLADRCGPPSLDGIGVE